MWPRGRMYMTRSRGPRTEPWGTPCVRGELGDLKLPMETNCSLAVRYDLNKVNGVPVIPKSVSSRVSSVLWQTGWWVSKAAVSSSNRRMPTRPVSAAMNRLFMTLTSAVSVLCWALKPDWNTSHKLWCVRCCWICEETHSSAQGVWLWVGGWR